MFFPTHLPCWNEKDTTPVISVKLLDHWLYLFYIFHLWLYKLQSILVLSADRSSDAILKPYHFIYDLVPQLHVDMMLSFSYSVVYAIIYLCYKKKSEICTHANSWRESKIEVEGWLCVDCLMLIWLSSWKSEIRAWYCYSEQNRKGIEPPVTAAAAMEKNQSR